MSTKDTRTEHQKRKDQPLYRGLVQYFPDACATLTGPVAKAARTTSFWVSSSQIDLGRDPRNTSLAKDVARHALMQLEQLLDPGCAWSDDGATILENFPLACLAIAELSRIGNDQHNPGQPMHWAREKSTDHGDCILRHQIDAPTVDSDGVLHATKVAWRALAQLQVAIEATRPAVKGYPEAGPTRAGLGGPLISPAQALIGKILDGKGVSAADILGTPTDPEDFNITPKQSHALDMVRGFTHGDVVADLVLAQQDYCRSTLKVKKALAKQVADLQERNAWQAQKVEAEVKDSRARMIKLTAATDQLKAAQTENARLQSELQPALLREASFKKTQAELANTIEKMRAQAAVPAPAPFRIGELVSFQDQDELSGQGVIVAGAGDGYRLIWVTSYTSKHEVEPRGLDNYYTREDEACGYFTALGLKVGKKRFWSVRLDKLTRR